MKYTPRYIIKRLVNLIPPKYMMVICGLTGMFVAVTFMALSFTLPPVQVIYPLNFLLRTVASGEAFSFACGCLSYYYYTKWMNQKQAKLKAQT